MVEVQCSSCHTRYRVDEQVLPEGTPTFKCSRCGHVFSMEPRQADEVAAEPTTAKPATRSRPPRRDVDAPLPKSPAIASSGTDPEARIDPPPPSNRSDRSPVTPAVRPATPSLGAASAAADSARASGDQPIGKPAAGHKPSTEDLLSRPFKSAPEQAEAGENLAFDFHDEGPLEDHPATIDPVDLDSAPAAHGTFEPATQESARWEVGDDPDLETPAATAERFAIATPARGRRRTTAPPRGSGPEMLDEDAAPIYNHGVTRSARFFLALCLFVAAGFATATLAIHTAPAAALDLLNRIPGIGARFVSPVVPARMVALRDVHAEYRRGRDGRLALVIEGQAENVSPTPLHNIRIMSRIWTPAGSAVAQRQIYCGNSLATRTIAQMTTHEIEFFQELPPPKSFALESSSAAPFVIVFVDPPAQLAHFDIAVTEADAASPDDSPSPAG
jgi:predicted Zn finger-like uncharacterized protein